MLKMELRSSISDLGLPHYAAGEEVAIKLHMGERGNRTYIRPRTVRRLVENLQDKGCDVFVTDTTTLYQRKRSNPEDYMETAAINGFTEENVGCPVKIADAEGDRKVGNVFIAKDLFEADRLLVLSHATGHISTGFAGAVKNVAMGCVSKRGKRYIHSAGWPRYREDRCKRCGDCVEACPFGFVMLNDRIELDLKDCPACERCLNACPEGALWRPADAMDECFRRYAETCRTVLSCFPDPLFINELNRVTKFCDCSVDPGPVISPDLGFLAASDPIEIDLESVRLITECNPLASEIFGSTWRDFVSQLMAGMEKKA